MKKTITTPTETYDFSNRDLYNPVYIPTFNVKASFLHYFGSASSGKSYFAAQKEIVFSFLTHRAGRKTLVARRYYNTLENSCYAELLNVINEWGLGDQFHATKAPLSIVNKATGVKFIFIGLDDIEKVKSIRGVDRGWLEEATEVKSMNDLDQLGTRLRGFRETQWTLTYNPTSVHHWLNQKIHQKRPDGHFIFKTTYKDNVKLAAQDPKTIERLEATRTTNPTYWRVYGLGEWGQAVEGLIFPNHRSVAEMPCPPQAYGLDTGWNDQTGLVKLAIVDEIGKDKKQLYAQELIYETKLNIDPFMRRVRDLRLSKNIPIVYDPAHAGKLFADALKAEGYWVVAADKSEGSVLRGIKTVNEFDINIVAGSKNYFKEIQNYVWANKNGSWLDKPADGQFDHLMDPTRYGCVYLEAPSTSGSIEIEDFY